MQLHRNQNQRKQQQRLKPNTRLEFYFAKRLHVPSGTRCMIHITQIAHLMSTARSTNRSLNSSCKKVYLVSIAGKHGWPLLTCKTMKFLKLTEL